MNNHFDTLSAAEALEAAGIAPDHARAIVGQVNRAVDENVATKANVKALDTKIDTGLKALNENVATKADVKALDTKIDTGLKALDTKIGTDLKWMKLIGGAILAVLIMPWLAELGGVIMR